MSGTYFKAANDMSQQWVSPTGVYITFRDGFGYTEDEAAARDLTREIQNVGHPVFSIPTEDEIKVFENARTYGVSSSMGQVLADHELEVLKKYNIDPSAITAPVSTVVTGITTADSAIAAQTTETAANPAGTQGASLNVLLAAAGSSDNAGS